MESDAVGRNALPAVGFDQRRVVECCGGVASWASLVIGGLGVFLAPCGCSLFRAWFAGGAEASQQDG